VQDVSRNREAETPFRLPTGFNGRDFMADDTKNTSGGGNTGLALIVGGLVVVLAIVAYFVFARGGMAPESKDINVDVNLPEVSAPAIPPVN
jgi:hypothetical protein